LIRSSPANCNRREASTFQTKKVLTMIMADAKNSEPLANLEAPSIKDSLMATTEKAPAAMDDEASADKHKASVFGERKPHGLSMTVQTSASEGLESTDANSNHVLSPSFDDGEAVGEEDSFPVDDGSTSPSFLKHVFVGSPFGKPLTQTSISDTSPASLKDKIHMFETKSQLQRQRAIGLSHKSSSDADSQSQHSGHSRHTDLPGRVYRHHDIHDDDSLADYSVTSLPLHLENVTTTNTSPQHDKTSHELDAVRGQSIVSKIRQSRMQGYRSSARRDRLLYKLNEGRRGMTAKDVNRSRSFLPADKLIEIKQEQMPPKPPTRPESKTRPVTAKPCEDRELYVWLFSPPHKIFEVVRVPHTGITNIGEVLGRARACALDPVLAEQRYVSLCNDTLELVSPMVTVNVLFTSSSNNKELRKHSLLAVPEGYTAAIIRSIFQVLSDNSRVKRWLKQHDIFRPKSESERRRKRRAAKEQKLLLAA
jgi:hypothetical protein